MFKCYFRVLYPVTRINKYIYKNVFFSFFVYLIVHAYTFAYAYICVYVCRNATHTHIFAYVAILLFYKNIFLCNRLKIRFANNTNILLLECFVKLLKFDIFFRHYIVFFMFSSDLHVKILLIHSVFQLTKLSVSFYLRQLY